MVIWIIGLSGAGKTTIGAQLATRLKEHHENTVFIDGDIIRKIFSHENELSDYNMDNRKRNSRRIVEICKWLDLQGINVICSTLCLFEDILLDNRKIYTEYFEIYLRCDMKQLIERDSKGLYRRCKSGEVDNVVGIDLPYSEPIKSDLVINNDFTILPEELSVNIASQIGLFGIDK